jgi:hypothetical protein
MFSVEVLVLVALFLALLPVKHFWDKIKSFSMSQDPTKTTNGKSLFIKIGAIISIVLAYIFGAIVFPAAEDYFDNPFIFIYSKFKPSIIKQNYSGGLLVVNLIISIVIIALGSYGVRELERDYDQVILHSYEAKVSELK